MAKIYTEAELRLIHQRAESDEGSIYNTSDKVFQGVANGRIKEITDQVNITTNIGDIAENTEDIADLDNRLDIAEDDIDDLEATRAMKCFALAMSIVL